MINNDVIINHTGKYLGDAFDIPHSLHGQTFYAAVVLKVQRSDIGFLFNFISMFLERSVLEKTIFL